MTKKLFILFALLVLSSCATQPKNFPDALSFALNSKNKKVSSVVKNINAYEVQIAYTQIQKTDQGAVVFIDHEFQLDSENYFYPASTVKFPIAVLALEKLEQEGRSHETIFKIEGEKQSQSFASDIKAIFAVSDNEANNRLFEYLGTDLINKNLLEKGITPLRFSHRLSTKDAANPTTKTIEMYFSEDVFEKILPIKNQAATALSLKKTRKGTAYLEDEIFKQEAFDFSFKNYYSIAAQHALIKRVIFPENFKESERFNLGAEKRAFLLKSMHSLPAAQGYNPNTYYDSYGKFFMFGDKTSKIPKHIKIYNKVGYAYGTLTDCAYIEDQKNNVAFLLTATILVNKNGVFNDNQYEYDSIGIPFLAQLGREIYRYEKFHSHKSNK